MSHIKSGGKSISGGWWERRCVFSKCASSGRVLPICWPHSKGWRVWEDMIEKWGAFSAYLRQPPVRKAPGRVMTILAWVWPPYSPPRGAITYRAFTLGVCHNQPRMHITATLTCYTADINGCFKHIRVIITRQDSDLDRPLRAWPSPKRRVDRNMGWSDVILRIVRRPLSTRESRGICMSRDIALLCLSATESNCEESNCDEVTGYRGCPPQTTQRLLLTPFAVRRRPADITDKTRVTRQEVRLQTSHWLPRVQG